MYAKTALALWAVCGWWAIAELEQPANPTPRIAVPANVIPVPNMHQPNGWTCGASAMQAVCAYYGTGPTDLKTYIDHLGTTKRNGTEPEPIRDYARELGLQVDMKIDMTMAELKDALDKRWPVICEIQAWSENSDPKPEVYYNENKNGHYVVAVGYDTKNIYFEDPSTIHALGYIPTDEFDKRWHEKDKSGLHHHLGIVIWQKTGETPYLQHAEKID
jgi:predicted double-glycine peptidase